MRVSRTRLVRALRSARAVRDSVRFAAREMSRSQRTSAYRLRGSDLRAVIRHPLIDAWVLDEIFGNREYVLPAAVASRLYALGRQPRVLDLGGHVGLFGLAFLDQVPGASITSYEPDPDNVVALRECVRVNQLGDRWRVVEAAASTCDGTASFVSDYQLSQLGETSAALDDEHALVERVFPFMRGQRLLEVRQVTVATKDVFADLAECDFLKIDIQGGEWDLFADTRLDKLTAVALVIEVHPQSWPTGDARGYVRDRLEGLGYAVGPIIPAHGGELIVWATRGSV